MNIEEVKKFLTDNEEGKKLLVEMIESHDSITGLKVKNSDLLAANKKLKKERDDSISKLTELEEQSTAGKEDIEATIAKVTKKLQKELDDERNSKVELTNRFQKMVIENGLNDALLKANISKQHIPAVRALLKSENKIEIDEVENIAKIGNKDLTTFVTEWSQGDMGKHYVAAPQNSGGGATGSLGRGGVTSEDVMKMSPEQRINYARNRGLK